MPNLDNKRALNRRYKQGLRLRYWLKYQGRCLWCQAPVLVADFNYDHLIPGMRAVNCDTSHIVAVACRACNELRSHTPVALWLRWLGRLHGRLTLTEIRARLSVRHNPLPSLE